MSLFINETDHWEIPGHGELHSGDPVVVYLHGEWVDALVDYRPRKGYSLRLENGKLLLISEKMTIRLNSEVTA
jgi:hypothetical protein